MCSVAILRRPGAAWPVLIAANRDEAAGRPWAAPGRFWPDRPNATAGRDDLAGGSWMGVNDEGVVAVVLNRFGTLGPQEGKRSRGELVLDALDFADAADAADALSHLDCRAYRPFNLLLADNRDAFVVCNRGDDARFRPYVAAVAPGAHMLTAFELDDATDGRIARHFPQFAALPPADPAEPETWGPWASWLAARTPGPDDKHAMNFRLPSGFGTVSSSLVALPAPGSNARPVWRFCPGRPDETAWTDVFQPVPPV